MCGVCHPPESKYLMLRNWEFSPGLSSAVHSPHVSLDRSHKPSRLHALTLEQGVREEGVLAELSDSFGSKCVGFDTNETI